ELSVAGATGGRFLPFLRHFPNVVSLDLSYISAKRTEDLDDLVNGGEHGKHIEHLVVIRTPPWLSYYLTEPKKIPKLRVLVKGERGDEFWKLHPTVECVCLVEPPMGIVRIDPLWNSGENRKVIYSYGHDYQLSEWGKVTELVFYRVHVTLDRVVKYLE